MVSSDQRVAFSSGDLTLEGVLHIPDGRDRSPAVVVCHPHPRFGGDMDNSLVTAVAEGVRRAGMAVLRFNFRGVGDSEGAFDKGIGEAQDAREAAGYLALHERVDPTRVGMAGYSFGAWMALEASHENNVVQAVASIACPLQPFSRIGVSEMLQPKMLVCGELDHDFPAEQFKFLARRFTEPREVELLLGADHFFRDREPDVAEIVAGFFARRLGV